MQPREELVSYIKQNTGNGFSKEEIEQTLLQAGWSIQDILAAYSAAQQTQTAGAGQDPEIARLQKEVLRSTPKKNTSSGSGMAGWLINKGIVQNEQQANIVLIVIALGAIALALWFAGII